MSDTFLADDPRRARSDCVHDGGLVRPDITGRSRYHGHDITPSDTGTIITATLEFVAFAQASGRDDPGGHPRCDRCLCSRYYQLHHYHSEGAFRPDSGLAAGYFTEFSHCVGFGWTRGPGA